MAEENSREPTTTTNSKNNSSGNKLAKLFRSVRKSSTSSQSSVIVEDDSDDEIADDYHKIAATANHLQPKTSKSSISSTGDGMTRYDSTTSLNSITGPLRKSIKNFMHIRKSSDKINKDGQPNKDVIINKDGGRGNSSSYSDLPPISSRFFNRKSANIEDDRLDTVSLKSSSKKCSFFSNKGDNGHSIMSKLNPFVNRHNNSNNSNNNNNKHKKDSSLGDRSAISRLLTTTTRLSLSEYDEMLIKCHVLMFYTKPSHVN
ncbi:hypothetical protein HELRODRAFT_176381 [Helobdella robusta]|uniref:Uncharacterized protein n=1 Tax=Helobdella robusta TaxID=6412 RepID=T1FAG6_HELRO|nr:hypothetical protein HELRODRAFT_176381 [Helobdella robusta]ESO00071.1 hypothetical protein HELRODRAFT_176381 [Helobdella robusta]